MGERNVDWRLAVVRGEPAKSARDVEDERAALQSDPERRAGVAAPVVTHIARPEMHLTLVHDVGAQPHRLAAESARIQVAAGDAQLGVLHVMVDEFESIRRAGLHLRRQRISLVRLAGVEFSTKIPHGESKSERRADGGLRLRAQIHRARALDFRTHAGALARAIHPELYQLVIHAGRQPLAEAERVRAGEDNVAWENLTNNVAEIVGHLLLSDVQDVDRESSRSERAWQDEGERVTHTGDGLGVVNRQLLLRLIADRSRIPPDPFTARLSCDHCLPHADRLRPGW